MTTLLALSDVLIIRALERSCSRALTGAQRALLASRAIPRHHGYETIHIPPLRHARALEDAWLITAELAYRHRLGVDPDEWSQVLDRYCRGLLATCQPHTLDALERALQPLGLVASA